MLIYQDMSGAQHASPRVPAHLVNYPGLVQRQCDQGNLVAIGDAESQAYLVQMPQGADWTVIPGQWRVCSFGPFNPVIYIKPNLELAGGFPVRDTKGRSWHAPAILDAEGKVALRLNMKKLPGEDGALEWKRVPTPAQALWIRTAESARAEILANRIQALDINITADWCSIFHSAIYWPGADEFAALGFYDDKLIIDTLLAAAGFPRPKADA